MKLKRYFSSPVRSDFHIDVPLTEICIAYKPEGFIADQVFPQVPVDKQSDKYYIWTKGPWLRNSVEPRAPGDEYPEGRLLLSNDEYYCKLYHLGYAIPDEDRDNEDPGVELEITGAEWLKSQFDLNREIKIAAKVFAASWETNLVGGTGFTKWDDYDNSDPCSDINTGKNTVRKSTGKTPNTLIVGQEVFDVLAEHPLLVEKYKYTATGILDVEEVRKALKVDKLLVGSAPYESSAEGAATATRAYIWGKNAWLGYVAPAPGKRVPSAGYTFAWKQAGGYTAAISNSRQDWRDRDLLKGKYAFDAKLTGTDLGYYLATVID
jgi:hypothetical protein